MDKYRKVMDGIQQNPEEVRKLHENIDRILEQKSEDDFVSIEKTAHIVTEREMWKHIKLKEDSSGLHQLQQHFFWLLLLRF